VANDSVDIASIVWVSTLVERNTDQLMRGDVRVQPVLAVSCKSFPVTVATLNALGSLVVIDRAVGVPGSLAASVSDVLGSAGESDQIAVSGSNEGVGGGELLLPGLDVVEHFKLDGVEGLLVLVDGLLAVIQAKDVVAILDVSLVSRDRDDLGSFELLIPDESLQLLSVLAGIAAAEDLDVCLDLRPSLAFSCDHFNFQFSK